MSIIGRSFPRAGAARLAAGRGRYVDDLTLPRMVHVAFVRSPVAAGRIVSVDVTEAAAVPGVVRVFTGADLVDVCAAFAGNNAAAPSLKSPPERCLAVDRVCWQGEPIVAIVAQSRALAEDACERVLLDIDSTDPQVDPNTALEHGVPLVHPELGTNLAFQAEVGSGDLEAAFAEADHVLEHYFDFGRHTGVPLEPRGVLAEYEPAGGTLTVHQSHQVPHQQQDVYSQLLGIPEHLVQVICPDVGGAFGVKLHAYPDELATVAIAKVLGRPVKFIADRLESFVSDVHARDHRVTARLGVKNDGTMVAFQVEDLGVMGAFSTYPRTSVGEGMQVIGLAGGPYRLPAYRGRLKFVYQNKVPTSAVRAVGHPIAATITEQMVDFAAEKLGMDPVELRRRNQWRPDDYPTKAPGGFRFERLSLDTCLEKMVALMDYDRLRAEQAELRQRGIYRGIGIATFVEITAVGAGFYGPASIHISAQDGATVRLEPSGKVRCAISVTDQGQGINAGIAQVVAARLGLLPHDVDVLTGDSRTTPYGGGAWASRGMAIGGEAAWAAAGALRDNILSLAGILLQAAPDTLDLRDAQVVDAASGVARLPLSEVARIGHFRQDTLPPGLVPELAVTRHWIPRQEPYYIANGIQASHLEVDTKTGVVRLLHHWVVEDCGRVINPLLVDEQIRGGVVQGLGAALYEHCRYDEYGQLISGSLLDYLVPMAGEMPDITIGHVETRAAGTELGAKGAGEAGAGGASSAVWCALHDALRPFGARIAQQPFTPEVVLDALDSALSQRSKVL